MIEVEIIADDLLELFRIQGSFTGALHLLLLQDELPLLLERTDL
jgi:hypothetical protein